MARQNELSIAPADFDLIACLAESVCNHLYQPYSLVFDIQVVATRMLKEVLSLCRMQKGDLGRAVMRAQKDVQELTTSDDGRDISVSRPIG